MIDSGDAGAVRRLCAIGYDVLLTNPDAEHTCHATQHGSSRRSRDRESILLAADFTYALADLLLTIEEFVVSAHW